MAAKKKTAAKKPVATAKKTAPAKQRLAVKLLTELPPLDERRRRVYRAAFTDEQCDAWGKRTKAENVEGEAERFVGTLSSIMKKGDVGGYSRYRLSWLCHLVGELNDAIDADGAGSADSARTERAAAVTIANKARKRIVNGLMSVAQGNEAFTRQITDRNESSLAPHALESTLTGLLQLAVQARRSEDGALLSDDAGLSEEFLSSISAITEALRESNEATYSEDRGTDSTRTNRIEGRVLREMAFALATLRRAREAGDSVPAIVPGKNLTSITNPRSAADDAAAAPTPPSKERRSMPRERHDDAREVRQRARHGRKVLLDGRKRFDDGRKRFDDGRKRFDDGRKVSLRSQQHRVRSPLREEGSRAVPGSS